jgi:malate dehydrogenase (oxaloacetate-decarboxylating)
MQQRVIPLLVPPLRKHRPEGVGSYEAKARGIAVLTTPLLNKGTAFTAEERESLGLNGLLPPVFSTLDAQAAAAYAQYQRLPDALSKNIYLTALHDRNEVLFFRVLSEHLREMIPIVNHRTVGLAMEEYHHEIRRPRGVYLSIDHPDGIEEAFGNLEAGPDDIDLILATDAEQIFGIGDWGVGGIEISIGKLAIYTAAGGIDPTRVIPVMLDVGTNRESLLADPMYPGNRHARVRGERYDAFIDAYVKAVVKLFPSALMQWEDLGPGNARRILQKYRSQCCIFNDNLQGTGAIILAAAVSAMRICGALLRNQRVVIFGTGLAGIGIADVIRDAMIEAGLPGEDATRRFWCVDAQGLLVSDLGDMLRDYQAAYARPAAEVRGWRRGDAKDSSRTGGDVKEWSRTGGDVKEWSRTGGDVKEWSRTGGDVKEWSRASIDIKGSTRDSIGLAEVIRQVRPTMLIGTSGMAGAFTEAIVRDMARHTDRPIIFPLSSPPPLVEATPADLIAWTDGRALIATGSPFTPVTHKGVTHVIGQAESAMLYPGLGLGAIVSRSRLISVGMLAAAANALSSLVAVRLPGASLLPYVEDLRTVTVTVAVAVAEAAVAEGLAGVKLADIVQQVEDAMWQPEYRRILAS